MKLKYNKLMHFKIHSLQNYKFSCIQIPNKNCQSTIYIISLALRFDWPNFTKSGGITGVPLSMLNSRSPRRICRYVLEGGGGERRGGERRRGEKEGRRRGGGIDYLFEKSYTGRERVGLKTWISIQPQVLKSRDLADDVTHDLQLVVAQVEHA